MVLAGDIGGTKTLLGLFDTAARRPRAVAVRAFATLEYGGLGAMVSDFVHGAVVEPSSVAAACFGVAGPVIADAAQLTNVPWRVASAPIARAFGFRRVALLNDLQATAYGVPVLEASEVHTLQEGEAAGNGHVAVIAAGTGLGEAILHNLDGRLVALPTEAGHADFAARTERDIALLRDLVERFGRAAVEDVVSGPGLVNIHRVSHTSPCPVAAEESGVDLPAAISTAALEGRCAGCVRALEMFVDAYGAEAGNLALRAVAAGGVFVGGGIAPKILPALTDGRFIEAFRAKAPFREMLSKVPVKVILNAETGLLGAAVYAAEL